MSGWDYLAVLLLLCPNELAVPETVPAPLFEALKRVTIRLDIVDTREHWGVSFRSELNVCRWRFQELIDAPTVDSNPWIPPPAYVDACVQLGYVHIGRLEQAALIEPSRDAEWSIALDASRFALEVWIDLYRASDASAMNHARRASLKRLRDRVGADAYHRGQWPSPVPLWTMPRRD